MLGAFASFYVSLQSAPLIFSPCCCDFYRISLWIFFFPLVKKEATVCSSEKYGPECSRSGALLGKSSCWNEREKAKSHRYCWARKSSALGCLHCLHDLLEMCIKREALFFLSSRIHCLCVCVCLCVGVCEGQRRVPQRASCQLPAYDVPSLKSV